MKMDQIRELAQREGPFVSIALDVETEHEDAADRLRIDWKDVRDGLERAGAPSSLLDPLDEVLQIPTGGGRSLMAVADGSGTVTSAVGPEPVGRSLGTFAPVPRLGPMLRAAAMSMPYVLVVSDRTGADIITVVDGEQDREEVEGDTEHIQRSKPGGWSQRRYQQRAENTWERNAAGVAEEVAAIARSVPARLVIAAGEQRSVGFLEQHLPKDVAWILREAEHGGRAHDGSAGALDHDVHRILATVAAEETVHLIDRFVELRDTARGAVEGPDVTFELLREAVVATLLVHDDADDDRMAWVDPSAPTLVALESRTLEDLGAHPQQGRLFDVAVWSALRTGADVHLVPGSGPRTPADGIGAIARGT